MEIEKENGKNQMRIKKTIQHHHPFSIEMVVLFLLFLYGILVK